MSASLAAWLGAAMAAHGAPPYAADFLGSDQTFVRLSRSLALSAPNELRYLCPTRWGGPDAPPMVAVDGTVLVAGFRGLLELDAKGALTAVETPIVLDGVTTRAMAAHGERAVAIHTEGQLVGLRPGPATVWATLTPPADSVAVTATSVIAAAADDDVLTLFTLTEPGKPPAASVLSTEYDATPSLNVLSDGAIYLRGGAAEGFRLDRVGTGEQAPLVAITTSDGPIHGPVEAFGHAYVLVDGALQRLDGDTLVPLPAAPVLSCLRAHETLGLLGCTHPDLVRIGEDGGAGAVAARFDDLMAPSLDGLDSADRAGCQLDWYDLATDAGFTDDKLIPAEWRPGGGDSEGSDVAAGAPVETGSGCTAGSAGGASVWIGLGLFGLCVTGRGRIRRP